MGNAVNMVPMDEPVAVDMTHVAKNTNATNRPPWMPTEFASHTNPPDRPLSFISAENMPTLLASEHGPKGILAETLVHGFLSEAGELPQLIRHILHRICIVCTGSVYGEVGHAVVSCDSAEGVGVCITRQGGVGNQAWLWQHA